MAGDSAASNPKTTYTTAPACLHVQAPVHHNAPAGIVADPLLCVRACVCVWVWMGWVSRAPMAAALLLRPLWRARLQVARYGLRSQCGPPELQRHHLRQVVRSGARFNAPNTLHPQHQLLELRFGARLNAAHALRRHLRPQVPLRSALLLIPMILARGLAAEMRRTAMVTVRPPMLVICPLAARTIVDINWDKFMERLRAGPR